MIVTGKVRTAYTSYNNRKQGLRKGGGLSPLLINIVGAAAPLVPTPMTCKTGKVFVNK